MEKSELNPLFFVLHWNCGWKKWISLFFHSFHTWKKPQINFLLQYITIENSNYSKKNLYYSSIISEKKKNLLRMSTTNPIQRPKVAPGATSGPGAVSKSTDPNYGVPVAGSKTEAKICLTRDTIHRIDIVSRCFENKNNNCCETKLCKNAICLLFTNPWSGLPDARTSKPQSSQIWICK